MGDHCVATFHSVSQALQFEKLLLSMKLAVKLLPVPRVISSSCGIAARFPRENLPEVERLAREAQAGLEGVYYIGHEGKTMRAEACPGPWPTEDF